MFDKIEVIIFEKKMKKKEVAEKMGISYGQFCAKMRGNIHLRLMKLSA